MLASLANYYARPQLSLRRYAGGANVMKNLPFLLLAAFTSFTFAHSSAHAQVLNRQSLPACFELKLGPWTPPIGGNAEFSTPPDTVKLLADSADSKAGLAGRRASPAIRHRYANGRERAIWTPLDSTSFRIVWTDGLTGADLRLFSGRGAYFGVIRALSDRIVPEAAAPKATVVATKVECNA